jgi:hypothetical protein
VGGIAVGTVRPGLVGGSVEVTKRTGASVEVDPSERFTQDVNVNKNRRVKGSVLFIGLKYNANKQQR